MPTITVKDFDPKKHLRPDMKFLICSDRGLVDYRQMLKTWLQIADKIRTYYLLYVPAGCLVDFDYFRTYIWPQLDLAAAAYMVGVIPQWATISLTTGKPVIRHVPLTCEV